MIKRPKRNEKEEDILRMQEEFLNAKAKNPKLEAAAKVVKVEKPGRKSVFAQTRLQSKSQVVGNGTACVPILGEIHEKPATSAESVVQMDCTAHNIVLGDIVERRFPAAQPHESRADQLNATRKSGKSIFALSMQGQLDNKPASNDTADLPKNSFSFGSSSVIVDDAQTAAAVHSENVQILSQMNEAEILEERQKLLQSIDPALLAVLQRKRREKENRTIYETPRDLSSTEVPMDDVLSPSNSALDILERSKAENWLHFDNIESHKLQWMHEIPQQATEILKPGEKFEARFDWKGILLPYCIAADEIQAAKHGAIKDERELYLHGDEPQRAGYTLQELFRLARSNVLQQRLAAFNAIAGILNIYSQGFYDQVLELPISKIFFLLRFALDDNTPAMLEVVTKALAFLFYNETDEILLDVTRDNPGCYWQPALTVLQSYTLMEDDPASIENLQKQMEQLQLNARARSANASIAANIDESEEESKTSMNDFQLAETDLVDCLLRTNILQRVYFILQNVRPNNSTVASCLKLLIRMARSGKDVATKIMESANLLSCLLENFLPGLEKINAAQQPAQFYAYPQYLLLKLLRVLASQNLRIAFKLSTLNVLERLRNYLYNCEDMGGTLVKVQIEALRLLQCLFLLNVDVTLYKTFLPAFRCLLEWHFNHMIYEMGGPFLIRQHAAAVLAAVTAGPGGSEAATLLGDMLHNCCCSWFHKATHAGPAEFSQATLLSACLNAVGWYARHCDVVRFHKFANYLHNFVKSPGFVALVDALPAGSIILRAAPDRRNVHPPLPGIGSVLMPSGGGPQLIVPQTYAVHLLMEVWRLLELRLEEHTRSLLIGAIIQPKIVEPLAHYLRQLGTRANRYLATNFYAKAEVKFVCKLLCFEGFQAYFEKPEMLLIVYNFLGCLTAEYVTEIEQLFERVIFNKAYLAAEDQATLDKWRTTCLELVHSHYIVVPAAEITLTLPANQVPILPSDWPYFQLRTILQNFMENVQQPSAAPMFAESEILRMTFTFVDQLETQNAQLEIGTPTEKLMYLMIAFMGPDSQFLSADIQALLRQHIVRFCHRWATHTFQFDAVYEGKCKFESLYALFVDHFQAASYGNELFGCLLLIPLAQKYDNKWRRRVWSDYAAALRFLHCDESLLIGGLQSYLEPVETDESLIRAYAIALNTNLVRPNTIPYKIAEYHVAAHRKRLSK